MLCFFQDEAAFGQLLFFPWRNIPQTARTVREKLHSVCDVRSISLFPVFSVPGHFRVIIITVPFTDVLANVINE